MSSRVPRVERKFSGTVASVGLLTSALGWEVLTNVPGSAARETGVGLLLVGGTATVGSVARAWHNRAHSTGLLGKWSRRSQRNGGVASGWDLLRAASGPAMRRRATVLRPSLAELSQWRRLRTPVTAFATPLAEVGWHTLWSPCEDVTMRVGGPRVGKTGELACRIVDAPGAVIATSTRTDLVELTAASRALIGPVGMFNPSGLGGLASTVKWSPLHGCRIPGIASRRGRDMIPDTVSVEAERWDQQARRVLSVLLHAAALQDLPMRSVLAWVADPGPRSAQQVERALERSPEQRPMVMAAQQFFGTNEKTRTSITATIMPALGWLTDSRAATIGDAPVDEVFDVPTFLAQRGTLYLLGAEDGLTAPLIAALTAEIAHQGRMLAAGLPGGRLDPPLTLALDEAALICPVPLDRWSADMGGRNITLHISVQSRAQLRQRWGDAGAGVILNNTATILIYGGTRDPGDLDTWSKLAGEREETTDQIDGGGQVSGGQIRKVPVLGPADIANLPAGHVIIIRRGIPASIGKTTMAWTRSDIRRANKRTPYRPILETDFEPDAGGDDDAA